MLSARDRAAPFRSHNRNDWRHCSSSSDGRSGRVAGEPPVTTRQASCTGLGSRELAINSRTGGTALIDMPERGSGPEACSIKCSRRLAIPAGSAIQRSRRRNRWSSSSRRITSPNHALSGWALGEMVP